MIQRVCALLRMQPPIVDNRGLLSVSGATVPTDGTDGYQTGCIFQHTDGTAGTALYVNEGSVTSCDFNAIETPGGATLTIADLADVADAFATRLLETGTYSSEASKGVTLSSTNTRPFSLLYDDAGSALSNAGVIRGMLSRILLTADVAGSTILSARGQLKLLDGVDTETGIYAPVQGYIEVAGTSISKSGSTLSCLSASLEIGTALTAAASGEVAGLHVETTGSGTLTATGTVAGILIDKATGAADWPVGMSILNSTTAINIGSCTTGISMAGTYGGNGINCTGTFADHVIDIQPGASLGDNKAVYIGTWGSEAEFNDGGGLFRMYGKPGAGGGVSAQIFVRALTDCTSSNCACQLYADSDADTPGPTNVEALNCFAMLNAGKYLAASTSWMQGLKAIWAKVGADNTSVCNGNVAPLWIDNQINCAVGGEEYGIFASTGGSRPDGFIGFETTSSGYDQLLYFDATFNSGAGTCITTDSVPGTQDARIKVYYDGKQYYIPLYR